MKPFPYKTSPFDHQRRIFEDTWSKEAFAIFAEQGTGKTKIILDTAAKLYMEGRIDALLVVAPRGVAVNWINEEIPRHLSDAVVPATLGMVWRSTAAGTKKHEAAEKAVLSHKGLAVVSVGYEAIVTTKGRDFARKFLTRRRVLFVADESHAIKSPGAKRVRAILAAAKLAPYRRALTGTPASQSPFDVYTQIRFCDGDYWKQFGLGSFLAFSTFFGIWNAAVNHSTGQGYKTLVAYQNLNLLHKWLAQISVRVTKEDTLDLPPKLYSTRTFEMTPEQRRLYNSLVSDFVAVMANGAEISAPLAIVRMLRLQQVACGYLPNEKFDEDGYPTGNVELVSLGENPRLELLRETCEALPSGAKALIWARFTEDINQIVATLAKDGRRVVRYDGKVKDKERSAAIEAFQNGDAEFFVANPAAGGTGITLHAAKTVIYYSNSFKLVDRQQSEDRAHRAGLLHPVHYTDIVAAGTIDVHVLKSLQQKINVAAAVTGDKLREWVTLA